jgi:hypothetical protein
MLMEGLFLLMPPPLLPGQSLAMKVTFLLPQQVSLETAMSRQPPTLALPLPALAPLPLELTEAPMSLILRQL